jgi:hypothetical protein
MPMEVRAPPHYYYYYYYYYYYQHHHHLICTTTTNNNNNNKIIRNVILTKSLVNIIIFTYNKEILWTYLTLLRHSKMFFVLKFEWILIIGWNNVLTEGARKVYRGRRVGQAWSRQCGILDISQPYQVHVPCVDAYTQACSKVLYGLMAYFPLVRHVPRPEHSFNNGNNNGRLQRAS